jgi:AcrR family transcriptional regulator
MARVVKEEEHAVKRNEILDAAQRLIYSKGYEQMSIQDILNALQISKGAFYHYFGSKQAVLDALVARMSEQAELVLQAIVQDPQLTALEKMQGYFLASNQWKTARKDFLLALLRVYYDDHNAIFRQKIQAMSIKRVAPMVAAIIRQGVAEGVFVSNYPDETGAILMNMLIGLGDTWSTLLLANPPPPDTLPRLERLVAACTETVTHILGAPAGVLTLMDEQAIKTWATVA